VTGIELVQCISVFDTNGRFCPSFGNAKKKVDVDQVILAIGQTTDLSCLAGNGGCSSQDHLIVADPETLETDIPGVFAGGEVVSGPGVIVEAVSAGKRAAAAVDRFLGGDGLIQRPKRDTSLPTSYDGNRQRGFADLTRKDPPTLPVPERHTGFPEVELPLDDASAVEEANRCLQCDMELQLIQDNRSKS
jgi:hypothetical protein